DIGRKRDADGARGSIRVVDRRDGEGNGRLADYLHRGVALGTLIHAAEDVAGSGPGVEFRQLNCWLLRRQGGGKHVRKFGEVDRRPRQVEALVETEGRRVGARLIEGGL